MVYLSTLSTTQVTDSVEC